ncbi:hypothetical protein FXO37_24879 [Capsicum annuum]|nr:hypothetical protein FXO37_24879 [Capsicum annuum]
MTLTWICRIIFFPLWVFHAVVARGRFSLPAPSVPYDRHWAPCHAVVATPLLIAFELLLCIHLESIYVNHSAAVNLKIVFLPLLVFEVIILIDNFRYYVDMFWGLQDKNLLFVCVCTVFLEAYANSSFPLFTFGRDVGALGWWDLFINYGIAECFAFLVCTKWSNPTIHRSSDARGASSSSTTIRYLDWNSGLVVSSEEEPQRRMCGLQDLGGHIMKIPIIFFQVLLCMRLEVSYSMM